MLWMTSYVVSRERKDAKVCCRRPMKVSTLTNRACSQQAVTYLGVEG